MPNYDIDRLTATVDAMKGLLKDGLVAMDIWNINDGLSLAAHNGQPAAVGLFTLLTNELVNTLKDSGFPPLNRYYLLDMAGDHTVMLIRHNGDLLQGMMLNNKKVNLGVLLSVALPRSLEMVGQAVQP